ncbi:MAG: flagellar hook-basal body complex protein FliE [Caldimonas sp.]|uniref:flagellar hook-basal body complex protein FliE n=1 Tax=Caldimonas sp. TaxID=2838790 RepID=UPI00391D4928
MDVRLKPFNFQQALAKSGMALPSDAVRPGRTESGPAAVGFSQALSQALKTVSATQLQASEMQRQVQLGNPTVSLEETMVTMQKAQIGFQATLQVRNRLVQAYTDIMNMSV